MDVAHGFQDNLGIFILCEKQIVRAAKSERRQLQRAQSLRHRNYFMKPTSTMQRAQAHRRNLKH
jgi:hypothetical protein